MTQENTVSFKVFLNSRFPDTKPEVRRFGIDRDVVSNYAYLVEKLQNVFPSLRNKLFDVSWKDYEGDGVMISTDDELMIALTEIPGDIRKLYVSIKEEQPKENLPNQTGKPHPGVVCDGCDNDITGFRYKCVECSNYDLCTNCEARGLHPEHFVMRLPIPLPLRLQFSRRLANHLSKALRKLNLSFSAEKSPESCGEAEQCCGGRQKNGHGHNHSHGYGHSHGHSHRHGHWQGRGRCQKQDGDPEREPVDLMEAVNAVIDKLCNGFNINNSSAKEYNQNEETDNSEGAKKQPNAFEESSSKKKETSNAGTSAEKDGKVQYLHTIGQAVADLLDPFGVAVNVIVENNEVPQNGEDLKAKEGKSNKQVKFSDEKKEEVGGKSIDSEATKESTDSEAAIHVGVIGQEKDGWAWINGPNKESSVTSTMDARKGNSTSGTPNTIGTGVNGSANVNTPTGAIPKSQGHNVFYPPPSFTNLPVTFPTVTPAAHAQWQIHPPPAPYALNTFSIPLGVQEPQRMQEHTNQQQQELLQKPFQQQLQQPLRGPLHPDPKIAQAIETMVSMGFSNEGGWLTQLVEMKQGNIDKVLDVLQPVSKK